MVRSPSLKGSRRLFRRGRTSQACSKGKTHTGFSSALAGPMAFFFFLVGTLLPFYSQSDISVRWDQLALVRRYGLHSVEKECGRELA